MLRAVVVVLLLANLGFFAWSQGWLDGIGMAPAAEREPQRLAQQIAPETIRVLSPAAASAALAAPVQRNALPCLEAGPFTAATIEAAEQVLADALPDRAWIRLTRESGTDLRLRVENATPEVSAKLRALKAEALGGGFAACPR